MAICRIPQTRIAGIASAVPRRKQSVDDLAKVFGSDDARKISDSTGVVARHVAPPGLCASDLCLAAGESLLGQLTWDRSSVDALIFVSQTPDYLLPATSCALHGRLGLNPACAAFDVNLGCSGYVYGLMLASQLISSGAARRALLLVGDCVSRLVSPVDRSTAPLFGDAGTATAIEFDAEAAPTTFNVGTDGRGANHLIVPAGSFRHPRSDVTSRRTEREGGNIRSDEDLSMNGAEIFSFVLREVPALVNNTLQADARTVREMDHVVMHQANQFMLRHLAKRLEIGDDQMVLALREFGNTSCASIPLSITHCLSTDLRHTPRRLLLVGFGVGFSWGAASVSVGPAMLPELILVDDPPAVSQGERAA